MRYLGLVSIGWLAVASGCGLGDNPCAADGTCDEELNNQNNVPTGPTCGDVASLRADAIASSVVVLGGVSLASSAPIADLLASPATYDGQVLQIEGSVLGVCDNRGCWVSLSDGKVSALNLKVTDGAVDFRDYTAVGLYMVGEGVFQKTGEHGAQLYIQSHGAKVGTLNCP
ncbi:MAG: hypothetical protein HY903_00735 [Deltaproteobacteria bacterium]|nr:hypothetical protein [Deltaproteobacteria bacterium]